MNAAFALHTPLVRSSKQFAVCKVRTVHHARAVRNIPEMSIAESSRETSVQPIQSTAKFSWTERWFPVLLAEDFDTSRPYAFTIWETNLVMFQDGTGKYIVLDDICPHRAAPLSEGRVCQSAKGETVIECPYHGWSFNGCGSCVSIPQLKDGQRIPSAANMRKVYQTFVSDDGIVWVWFGEEGKGRVEEVSQVGKGLRKENFAEVLTINRVKRELPYDSVTLVENLIDPEHAKWSHRGVEKRWNRTKYPSQNVLFKVRNVDDYTGEIVAYYSNPDERTAGDVELVIKGIFEVLYKSRIPGFGIVHTHLFSVPRGRDQCTIIGRTTLFLEKRSVTARLFANRPTWMQHWHVNLILDGDTSLLRTQQRRLESLSKNGETSWKKNYVLAMGTLDAAVIAFRKWLDRNIASMPWKSEPTYPHAIDTMSREQLLDRYHTHTESCKACSAAMRNMQRLRVATLIVAATCALYMLSTLFMVLDSTITMTTVDASLGTSTALSRAKVLLNAFKVPILGATGVVVLSLVLAAALGKWVTRFVYTERSYQLTHAD